MPIVTSESRDRPDEEEGEERDVFSGDYSYELAMERIEVAIRAHEHARVVKQLRLARREPRGGLVARSAALIMTLFR